MFHQLFEKSLFKIININFFNILKCHPHHVMTPDQLITFTYVAEHGNISHAAQRLCLSQPAVSGQLAALQQSFGEPIYRRKGRGVVLTPAGQTLLLSAMAVRRGMEQAVACRQSAAQLLIGELRLGASTTPASYLLPQQVARFRNVHPGVTVQMVDGNSQEIMSRLPALDVAFIEGALPEQLLPGTSVYPWHEDEVLAVMPKDHPFAKRRELDLKSLAQHPLVMREVGSGVRRLVEGAFRSEGIQLPVGLDLAGVEGIKQAVRAGLGIGFVSRLSLEHDDGTLVGRRIGKNGLLRTIHVLVPHAQAISRPAEVFLNQCLNKH